MSSYQSPRDDWPDLRDLLTDDGHELPPTILPPRLHAHVPTWLDGPRAHAQHPCACHHGIDDHQPVHDVWLIGAKNVTETREQCAKCDCQDFEEEDTNA